MNKLQRMAIKVHIPAIDKDSLSDYNKLEIQRFPKTSMRDFARGGNMWGLHLAVKAHAKEASKHEHQEVLTACLLGALESKHATGNALRLLVKAGAELKTDDHMMHVACGRTYLENLRFLADECKMLEQKDYSKIMYYASINGNIEVMEYLLKEKKASAEYFNDRHPVNFEDSANYLIKLLPLMEEAGFNFDLHKKCLLSSALYVNNDALIKHVWSRFTPHDKGALTMGAIPTDVAGGNVTIGDLLEKYGIEPEGYAMHKAYTAVKERDLDKLKKIIEEDNFDINARSRLLSLAFKQESTLLVKELYALGASFQKKSS